MDSVETGCTSSNIFSKARLSILNHNLSISKLCSYSRDDTALLWIHSSLLNTYRIAELKYLERKPGKIVHSKTEK